MPCCRVMQCRLRAMAHGCWSPQMVDIQRAMAFPKYSRFNEVEQPVLQPCQKCHLLKSPDFMCTTEVSHSHVKSFTQILADWGDTASNSLPYPFQRKGSPVGDFPAYHEPQREPQEAQASIELQQRPWPSPNLERCRCHC